MTGAEPQLQNVPFSRIASGTLNCSRAGLAGDSRGGGTASSPRPCAIVVNHSFRGGTRWGDQPAAAGAVTSAVAMMETEGRKRAMLRRGEPIRRAQRASCQTQNRHRDRAGAAMLDEPIAACAGPMRRINPLGQLVDDLNTAAAKPPNCEREILEAAGLLRRAGKGRAGRGVEFLDLRARWQHERLVARRVRHVDGLRIAHRGEFVFKRGDALVLRPDQFAQFFDRFHGQSSKPQALS